MDWNKVRLHNENTEQETMLEIFYFFIATWKWRWQHSTDDLRN